MQMHTGQLSVSPETVRELVDAQFPQWRDLPVESVASEGTVNAIFRIGDRLAARFPLQPGDVASTRKSLEAEAEAAHELAGRTPFRTPEPVAIGGPGSGYPLPWSVQTWLPGAVATAEDPSTSTAFAKDLAEFIHGVRAIGTHGRTFRGEGRGGELPDHDAWVETCFDRSEEILDADTLDLPRLRRIWDTLRELPPSPAGPAMTHGDLIPGNVLVSHGRLTGVIDVGGLGPADPALDLVGGWHLLDAGPRQVLRTALGSDDVEWERGKAWAFEQAMGTVWYYVETNPPMSRMGHRTLQRILADEPSVS